MKDKTFEKILSQKRSVIRVNGSEIPSVKYNIKKFIKKQMRYEIKVPINKLRQNIIVNWINSNPIKKVFPDREISVLL